MKSKQNVPKNVKEVTAKPAFNLVEFAKRLNARKWVKNIEYPNGIWYYIGEN